MTEIVIKRTKYKAWYMFRNRFDPTRAIDKCGREVFSAAFGGICTLRTIIPPCARHQTPTTLVLAALRDGDHDFSLGVSCFKIPERFSSLMQWVASIDNRRNAPGLEQLLHERQILLRWVLHKGAEPLPMLLRSPRP